MNLSIKLPPNKLDTKLLRGSGDEYFERWQTKYTPENYDPTFKAMKHEAETVEKYFDGNIIEL